MKKWFLVSAAWASFVKTWVRRGKAFRCRLGSLVSRFTKLGDGKIACRHQLLNLGGLKAHL